MDLRVAIVSTCAASTPPRGYGGTELVVAALADALAAHGVRPTVFATGDSTCRGARGSAFARPVWPPDPLAELRHASAAWLAIARGGFDVVHVHQAQALAFTSWVDVPAVATVHHDRTSMLIDHYRAYPEVGFVAISRRQAELAWEVPFRAVIHHGLAVDAYPSGAGAGGYCAFLGRFAAAKAPHLAIDAAAKARTPLLLAGEPQAPERAYFAREVAPRLRRWGTWIGEVDRARKLALLGGARALLFPIEWEEPFGLVMIEAMLMGTPVLAFRCGSSPEVVEDGVTGWLVDDADEMAARLAHVDELDRRRCRARARERWSAHRMAAGYAELYRRVARAPLARPLRAGAKHGQAGRPGDAARAIDRR